MTVSAYNVVNNPEMYGKLTAELKDAFPNPDEKLEFVKLEKLPYLVTHNSHSQLSSSNFKSDRSNKGRTKVSYFL